ncbi:hypothetical protein [Mangrovicoccus ximenensis]|nr:hypothetical protein [Mangrovicoccus ximenensis]
MSRALRIEQLCLDALPGQRVADQPRLQLGHGEGQPVWSLEPVA